MCSLSHEKVVKTTTDIESLRSEIRDNSVRVIDVRREEDYKHNHIPTSVNLPLAKLLSDDSPERVLKLINSMGIDDETSVVVYDDTFGALASRVAWTLEYLGHSDVLYFEPPGLNHHFLTLWISICYKLSLIKKHLNDQDTPMSMQL